MKTYLAGVQMDLTAKEKLFFDVQHILEGRTPFNYLVTPNPEILVDAIFNEDYRYILNKAILAVPDGVGLAGAGFFTGIKSRHIIKGRVLARGVLDFLENKKYALTVILNTSSLSSEAEVQKFFALNFPQIKLQVLSLNHIKLFGSKRFVRNEFIENNEVSSLKNKINEFKPHAIFICLGAPYQEHLAYYLFENKIAARLGLCLGGSIDFLLGKQQIPPKFLEKFWLEWLWRLLKQPKRIGRIFKAVILFPLFLIYWQLRSKFFLRPSVIFAILNKQNEVLICHSANWNEWTIPQGGVEFREKALEAAFREIKEEINISSRFLKVLAIKRNFNQYYWKDKQYCLQRGYKGQKQTLVVMRFLGQDQEIKVDEKELDGFKWVRLSELKDNLSVIRQQVGKRVSEQIETIL